MIFFVLILVLHVSYWPPCSLNVRIGYWKTHFSRPVHLCAEDWCQGCTKALIAPLSPIKLLIRKPRLIWLLPRCIWLHLPGRAMSHPSCHPFSKLLIRFRVAEGSSGQMDTHTNINTKTHSARELLVCLGIQTWSSFKDTQHYKCTNITLFWFRDYQKARDWVDMHSGAFPSLYNLHNPFSISEPPIFHLTAFLIHCVLRNEPDHGGR